jgi:hypothetical protein
MLLADMMEYYTTEIQRKNELHMSITGILIFSAAGVALVFASLPLFVAKADACNVASPFVDPLSSPISDHGDSLLHPCYQRLFLRPHPPARDHNSP